MKQISSGIGAGGAVPLSSSGEFGNKNFSQSIIGGGAGGNNQNGKQWFSNT